VMMGFPTFFSMLPLRFLSMSSIAESSFSITEIAALSSLTFSSHAPRRAARTPALEGAIARGAERGRGVEGADAQVNHS